MLISSRSKHERQPRITNQTPPPNSSERHQTQESDRQLGSQPVVEVSPVQSKAMLINSIFLWITLPLFQILLARPSGKRKGSQVKNLFSKLNLPKKKNKSVLLRRKIFNLINLNYIFNSIYYLYVNGTSTVQVGGTKRWFVFAVCNQSHSYVLRTLPQFRFRGPVKCRQDQRQANLFLFRTPRAPGQQQIDLQAARY